MPTPARRETYRNGAIVQGLAIAALILASFPAGAVAQDHAPVFALPPDPTFELPTHHLGAGWYALAIGGQLADALATRAALARSDPHAIEIREANPAMRGLASGPVKLVVFKGAVGVGGALLGDYVYRRGLRFDSKRERIAGRLIPAFVGGIGMGLAYRAHRTR